MNDIQRAKIQRFLDDEVMASAVHEVLFRSFVSAKVVQDVQVLAAARLALDFLEQGWRELQKSVPQTSLPPVAGNQGL